MELFLNLLWVLIAAGAIGVWRTSWRSEKPRSRRESLREWTAMGCALVLLFFAVSLTDDLNAAAMLLDECSASRRNSISSHHAERSKQIVKETGPAILPRIASAESPLTYLRGVSLGSYAVKFFVHGLSEGRAPPPSIP
ncbi:MAG: hypothetical protein WCC03_20040 [Candidatus Acidiferrales bacterium]